MVEKLNTVQKMAEASKQTVDRRERKREQAREEILAATGRVLLREGLAALTVDAVARELELTKAALYYYFPSKEALLIEVLFRWYAEEAHVISEAVEQTESGAEALCAIVRTVIDYYAGKLDRFRLVYLHAQVFGRVELPPEHLERVRPLNALTYGGAEQRLARERKAGRLPDDVNPRRLAFSAHMAALGYLTMKGMVESAGDPLIHSDAEMIAELCRTFSNAASKR